MKTEFLASALLLALLAGCASGVKLDDVPVEDKSATSSGISPGISTQAIGGNPSGAQTGVASVVVDKPVAGKGPAGISHEVFFDYDSYVVRAEARPVIESHARFLLANKPRKVNLEGHTDERGGREYNLALGQKRAEAVRQALGLLGVPEPQLEAISYGKEKPTAQGTSELELAKNRRVEIRY